MGRKQMRLSVAASTIAVAMLSVGSQMAALSSDGQGMPHVIGQKLLATGNGGDGPMKPRVELLATGNGGDGPMKPRVELLATGNGGDGPMKPRVELLPLSAAQLAVVWGSGPMNTKTLLAMVLISSGLTASAAVLLSKEPMQQAPVQSTIDTIQKLEASTPSLMTMQRPI
jgi:hypothetical protein